jgi:Fe2+ or Zn2+ uptake regulation protein
MIGRQQKRILDVLAAHPGGLCAENLLAALASRSPQAQRLRMIMAITTLKTGGAITIAGGRCVPSALIAPVRLPAAAHD